MGILGFVLLLLSITFVVTDLRIFVEWEIFRGYIYSFVFLVLVDWIRLSFGGLVLLISGIVMIYSGDYIGGDRNLFRFLITLILFVLSIILMIYSPNLIRILLGWDGLGLVSYCLVIYYQNMKSLNSGLLTILSNRVGDVAILIRISWLFNFGDWRFIYLSYVMKDQLLLVLSLVILASLTKRAQIPFSAWLPAAMAAPTPISALVHSSTLVTAGVYLIIRFNELLGVNKVLFYLSVGTLFMSGLGANFEMDLKRIIALSTLRQLGVMILSLSLGFIELAYFHLLMHALFKSLLFLCAGVYIHGNSDRQDIRSLGGILESTPLTSFYFLGCSFALCGFPFMSGYYSKDIILELFFGGDLNIVIFGVVVLATIFTITYSFRLFRVLVLRAGFQTRGVLRGSETINYLGPISVLFILAVVRGSFIGWFFMPNFLINLSFFLKVFILCFTIWYVINLIVYIFSDRFLKKLILRGSGVLLKLYYSTFWWLANISVKWSFLLKMGERLIRILDQGWTERLGPQGIFIKVSSMSRYGDGVTFLNFRSLIYRYLIFLIFIFLII